MVSVLETLLRKPTVDRYLASRFTLLQKIPAAARDRWQLTALEGLFAAGAWSELQTAARPRFDAWQLSPRFHFWLGVAALELGDPAAAHEYRQSMQTLLQLILLTGEGTADSPWTITYTTDAYDVARALHFRVEQQRLVVPASENDAARHMGRIIDTDQHLATAWPPADPLPQCCDVLINDSGEELWFDVSDLVNAKRAPSAQVSAEEPLALPEPLRSVKPTLSRRPNRRGPIRRPKSSAANRTTRAPADRPNTENHKRSKARGD